MKILAIEFSSPHRSVAVVEGSTRTIPTVLGMATETAGRNTHAIALVESALQQAAIEREAIECLAVGLGPGSYTGIRAAISLAQGWQLARGVKLLGISSVECLAFQAQADAFFGRVTCVIDAQRNEFCLATYEIQPQSMKLIEPLHLAGSEETQRRQATGERLIGPEISRWFAEVPDIFPDAATLGRMALLRADSARNEALDPIYLRETDFVKPPPSRRALE